MNKHEAFNSKEVDFSGTIEEIHCIAKDHGFWDSMDSVLDKMDSHLPFTDEEIIQVKKAFICQKIMLIVTELGESVEADRKSRMADWDQYAEMYKELERENYRQEFIFISSFEGYIKDTFEDELADAIIRIFDLCNKMGIDIIKHIKYKMEYNKTRKKMHGKEY